MLPFNQLLVIFAAFYGFIRGNQDVKISMNLYYNLYMLTNVIIEIMVNVFVAYYLPLGYIGYHILSNPLTHKIARKIYNKVRTGFY